MQQGDYSSYYHQYPHLPNPNPNPNPVPPDLPQNPYASAPPFNTGYASPDYPVFSSNYPPYPQNPDPVPPTAPSFSSTPPSPITPNPNLSSSFNQPLPQAPQTSTYAPYDSSGSYQQSSAQQTYYPPYDQHQTGSGYTPPPSSVPPIPNSNANPSYSSTYSGFSNVGSSVSPIYDNPYDNSVKFDQGSGYFDDRYDGYNRGRSDLGSDPYGKRSDNGGYPRYNDSYGDGVYAYEGGKVEPYGARGTAPKSSTWAMFDDYGRSISFPSGKDSPPAKIVKAVPKAETQQDVKSGVQKFRVKLLPESGGQSTMDVLCQVYYFP